MVPLAPNGISCSNLTSPGAQAVDGVTNSEVTMYGFGVTQNVDSAVTDFYLDYQHFSADPLKDRQNFKRAPPTTAQKSSVFSERGLAVRVSPRGQAPFFRVPVHSPPCQYSTVRGGRAGDDM